ncbi:MAG: ribose-phosphate diphosphokinase [Actinomycetota bacterium]|nr:ribose-phosphate diphosphokinase [Actinomycetota bacterium]
MKHLSHKKLHFVSGRFNRQLAGDIASRLSVQLGEANIADFANGEIHCRYGESIRGSDVFIFQSHGASDHGSINDAIMEQLIMIDAARRASAKRISIVAPFLGYSRQDRKSEGREPITAKLVCQLFESAGAERLLSIDLHSGQIQGFFHGPVDALTAMPVLTSYLRQIDDAPVVVSPDAGRVKVAERYANALHADLAIVHKRRMRGEMNAVVARDVVGEVAGRTCIIIDDMIDTAGTIVAAADQLIEHGAERVLAAATHGVFSGPAVDRLKNSQIERVVVTDTLDMPPEKQLDKIEVLSTAQIFADAISAVFDDTSVSEIFDGENLR